MCRKQTGEEASSMKMTLWQYDDDFVIDVFDWAIVCCLNLVSYFDNCQAITISKEWSEIVRADI